VIGWGSTKGVIEEEACEILNEEGISENQLRYAGLGPLHWRCDSEILSDHGTTSSWRTNYSGQLRAGLRKRAPPWQKRPHHAIRRRNLLPHHMWRRGASANNLAGSRTKLCRSMHTADDGVEEAHAMATQFTSGQSNLTLWRPMKANKSDPDWRPGMRGVSACSCFKKP